MGQGALSKPAVQWWLSLNSSKKVTFGVRLKSTRPSKIRSSPHKSFVKTAIFFRFVGCEKNVLCPGVCFARYEANNHRTPKHTGTTNQHVQRGVERANQQAASQQPHRPGPPDDRQTTATSTPHHHHSQRRH